VHASPIQSRSTFRFASKKSTKTSDGDRKDIGNRQTEALQLDDTTSDGIEMILNPTWKVGSRERVHKLKKIEVKANPMNQSTPKMKNQITNVNSKGQTKMKITNSSTIDSRERSSTDLVIGVESGNKWVKYIDTESGNPYWHNKRTGENTWVDPKMKQHDRTASQWA